VLTKFIPTYKMATTILVYAVLAGPLTGYAASIEYGGKAGFEHFKWEETDVDGSRLLTESGTRQVLSGFLGNTLGINKHFIYRAEAKLYFGTVHYDGQTQDGVPVQSDTTYSGLNLEGEAGFRAGRVDSAFAWDFVGRAGFDGWTRDIDNSVDSIGRFVSGTREQYTIMNLRFGTGPNWSSGAWQGRLIAGFKYPFLTDEYLKKEDSGLDEDINLEPKGRLSPFLNFYNYVRLSNRLWLTFDAFYDSYRFDKSDEVSTTLGGSPVIVWQPKSTQDNYGLQVGVSVSY